MAKCIDCGGNTADDDACCEFEESRRMGWCGSRVVPVPGCSCFLCAPDGTGVERSKRPPPEGFDGG